MDFKAKYKRSDYLNFFRNYLLPEDFDDQSEDVSLGFKPQHISKVTKIGEVPSLELNIYEVTHPSENDPRVSISRDAFRLLAQYGVKRALIVFNSESSSNFRLSLVTIDLKWEEGKRVQKEYSNPRRYSFFLGPETKTHTPEEYLVKQGRVKDFEDLKNRFSIEVVNKDFYTQIAVLFTQLAGGKRTIGRKSIDAGRGLLNLPSTVDDTLDKEFTVRLIGRLVFCWFLKKKRSDKNIPLLPEELLSSEAVSENKSYYHGILEPLFFQVLNTPVDSREKKYQNAPWSQIPFLNGGLFTPHHHDFYEPEPLGISKHINTLKVPDQWIKELFEVFEVYNFTIDENTSVDVELSIEPEMLGRIFENLLAEINPETGETARKATGSYYTPRPIVEYMVDESLKQYLLTETKLDENKIKSLLTYEDLSVKLADSERESVLIALDAVKVIDPACGSGAFPMGILQKMLLILQKVDPESEWWLERKLSQIESKLLKKELGKKLKSENVNYVHKLGIIQGSIYGVDIQPIAVEISKLRFFLSLIVDEKVNDAKENRGVEPLPNLEFKFVCTNSLKGLPKQEKSSDQLFETEDTQSINELKDLRDEYLRSYGIEKEKIQIKFLKIQKRMVEFYWQRILKPQTDLYGNKRELRNQEEPEFTRMLSSWDPFSDEPVGWFDPEWMFGIKDGFDIVIANPPYISSYGRQAQDFKAEDIQYYIQKFTTFLPVAKRKNISINTVMLFIESGHGLLKSNGCLCFIVDQALLNVDVYSYTRDFILQNFSLTQIVTDLNFPQVIAEACILLFDKISPIPKYDFLWKKKNVNTLGDKVCIGQILDNNHKFSLSIFDSLMVKIERDSTPLYKCVETFTGMQIIPEYFLSDDDNVLSGKKWHKAVFSSNIERYRIIWPNEKQKGKYITYDTDLQKKVRSMLQRKLEKGEKCRAPESLSIGSDEKEYRFYPPKIIMSQTVSNANKKIQLQACLDDSVGYYGNVSIHLIKHDDLNYLKFLVAILNSRLMSFYAVEKKLILGAEIGSKKTPQIRKGAIDLLPIKNISHGNQKPFVMLVDKIVSLMNDRNFNDAIASKIEKCQIEVDQMVYRLYGVTKNEEEIIEGAAKDK